MSSTVSHTNCVPPSSALSCHLIYRELPFGTVRLAAKPCEAVSPFSFRRTHGSREYKSSICQPVLRLFNSRSHADDLTHAACERRATPYHRAVVPLSMQKQSPPH